MPNALYLPLKTQYHLPNLFEPPNTTLGQEFPDLGRFSQKQGLFPLTFE